MEVTEIILAKVSRLCQLSSHSLLSFFLGKDFYIHRTEPMDFFGAQDTILWYKNASEGYFDKTGFVKFKLSNNLKQIMMKHN
jgi:hypothetical protein